MIVIGDNIKMVFVSLFGSIRAGPLGCDKKVMLDNLPRTYLYILNDSPV